MARNASRPGYDASHDYCLLRAFRQLVGGAALAVAGDAGSGALVYAYCASAGGGAVVLTAVNLRAEPLALDLARAAGGAIAAAPRTEWVFTAPGGNFSSTTPLLNGGGEPLRLAGDGTPPAMPGRAVPAGGGGLVLPPFSQSFVLLSAAGAGACA